MLNRPFKIGPYTLDNRLVLAPMAGISDLPFRKLCRQMGAGMAISEMMTANQALWATAKSLNRAKHEGESTPIVVQIAGSNPEQLAEAARLSVDQGADIIDINMGCPVKKVCNVLAGSALLKDPPLIGRLLDAVVAAVDVPVTLKTRTGWSRDTKNALSIARMAESAGIQAFTLHGRTRQDLYHGEAEYDTIAEVKAAINIPVIANGDITSPEKARFVLDYTQADAVMIGRAAQGNPFIFEQISHYLTTGQHFAPPTVSRIESTLLGHLDELLPFYGEYSACRIARKHIAWYTKSLENSTHFRQAMYQLEDCANQRAAVIAYFASLQMI